MYRRRMTPRATHAGLFGVALLGAIATLASCSSPLTLRSSWLDREVVIDGRDGEWEGAKYYIEKSNVDIGVLNDGEYLYLCVSAVERSLMMQVLGQGMTTWFNPKGNRDRAFGVRFPLGRLEAMRGDGDGSQRGLAGARGLDGRRRPGGAMGPGGGDRMDPRELEAFLEMALEGQELEILYDGDEEGRRVGLAESEVVEVRMDYDRGRLVYEMKVRLAQREPNGPGIGAVEGKRIGVGMMTAERAMGDRGVRRGDMGAGGMGGAGVPGAGMRPGRGMRPGMAPVGSAMTTPLEVWFQVRLAAPERPVGDSD